MKKPLPRKCITVSSEIHEKLSYFCSLHNLNLKTGIDLIVSEFFTRKEIDFNSRFLSSNIDKSKNEIDIDKLHIINTDNLSSIEVNKTISNE